MLLLSCENKNINKDSIKLIVSGKHQFLKDHNKQLITVDKTGKKIDDVNLYADSGDGCNSYLFENNSNFVVIDCNGSWFTIEKESGKINSEKWEWKKKLPKKYIGTYKFDSNEYRLIKENSIQIDNIYKFKDPN